MGKNFDLDLDLGDHFFDHHRQSESIQSPISLLLLCRSLSLPLPMPPPPQHPILYHLAPVPRWTSVRPRRRLLPGDVRNRWRLHASTADPSLLLTVGNSFYKGSKDDWLLLDLDVSKLGDREVGYEPAAPVGETQPSEELKKKQRKGEGGEGKDGEETTEETLFPHLYAGIPKLAIVKERKVTRGEGRVLLGDRGDVKKRRREGGGEKLFHLLRFGGGGGVFFSLLQRINSLLSQKCEKNKRQIRDNRQRVGDKGGGCGVRARRGQGEVFFVFFFF